MNGTPENQRLGSAPSVTAPTGTEKRCKKCGQIRLLSEFYRATGNKDKLKNDCKICGRELTKQWRQRNRQRGISNSRAWYQTNKERCKFNNKQWESNNYDKLTKARRIRNKRFRSKARGKLSRNISFSMWNALKHGSKRGIHWEGLVDYTVEQLKQHLEKLFTPGMSWGNYGTYWHIDHVIPIAAFNFEIPGDIDFEKCWSLKNLQPLEAKQNLIKGSRIDTPFQPSLALEWLTAHRTEGGG
jgi:hypothetical protein